MNNITLGILGGLGPMSGIYFCEMLVSHTKADCDQQHINFLLSSRSSTPDRTGFILGNSQDDPAPIMIDEAQRLVRAGADVIVIPCNTAHYFYDRIAARVSVPIINIIDRTVSFCTEQGFKRVGVLATAGTVASGAYKTAFSDAGIEYITCNQEEQETVNGIIYGKIKKNLTPCREDFDRVADALLDRGCDTIVLGCTELSLLKKSFALDSVFTDSLEVLAASAIRMCGKEPCGFDSALMKFERNVKYVIE